MSLDVYIKFKKKKAINYNKTHSACGSTMAVHDDNEEEITCHWSANITHNMGKMASHIPVSSPMENNTTLYDYVWRPEVRKETVNTTIMWRVLKEGIAYMINERLDLLQYNPSNGWGDYDSFLAWLINYKNMCEDNPGCEIEVSR